MESFETDNDLSSTIDLVQTPTLAVTVRCRDEAEMYRIALLIDAELKKAQP